MSANAAHAVSDIGTNKGVRDVGIESLSLADQTRQRAQEPLLKLNDRVYEVTSGSYDQHLAGARLLNQVIVVRDSLLGPLRSRLDGGLYALAHQRATEFGLCVEEARIVAEASCIKGALAMRDGVAPEPLSPESWQYHADLDAEAAWLARVGHAFATSDLVAATVSDHRALA